MVKNIHIDNDEKHKRSSIFLCTKDNRLEQITMTCVMDRNEARTVQHTRQKRHMRYRQGEIQREIETGRQRDRETERQGDRESHKEKREID